MYKEVKGDIFEGILFKAVTDSTVYYAQCISADGAMGAGIAVQFNKWFDTKHLVNKQMDEFLKDDIRILEVGKCWYQEPVFNLVTKSRYWEKPTIESFKRSVKHLVDCVENVKLAGNKIKEIKCPMLGCGIDSLNWDDVRPILMELAADLDLLGVNLTVIDTRLPIIGGELGGEAKTKEEEK